MDDDNENGLSVECQSYSGLIKKGIARIGHSFLTVGYYLKYIRDRRLYSPKYNSISEYALNELGMNKSTVSRFIAINDRFSLDGNSKEFQDRYKMFTVSQLSEMLALTDEQLEAVTVTTTVAQIRELKAEKTEESEILEGQQAIADIDCNITDSAPCDGKCFICDNTECSCYQESRTHCIYYAASPCTIKSAAATIAQLDPALYDRCNKTCCFNCDDESNCEYRCNPSGMKKTENALLQNKIESITSVCASDDKALRKEERDTKKQVKAAVMKQESPKVEHVIAEVLEKQETEPEEYSFETASHYTYADVQFAVAQEQGYIDQMKKTEMIAPAVKKTRMRLEALKLLQIQMKDGSEGTQPELPKLKNNDDRVEWLRNYRSWGIWYTDEYICARHYKYDFDDGSRLVVDEFMETRFRTTELYYNSNGTSHMHLIKPGGHYTPYSNSITEVVEFLKKSAKKG